MRCFQCKEYLSPINDGMIINEGHVTEMYLCDDCHLMEFDVHIMESLLIFKNKFSTP